MKKLLLLFLFMTMSIIASSQTSFEMSYFDDIIKNTILTPLPKGVKEKTISFPQKGYAISGKISKNILVSGTMIEITDARNNRTLQGQYILINGRPSVHGRLDYEHNGKAVSSYGKFYVSNYGNELITKSKKASDLLITEMQLDIWSGFWNGYPCLLRKTSDGYSLSINAQNKKWHYSCLNAEISDTAVKSFGHENIESLLLSDTLRVDIIWSDSTKFSGKAIGKISGNEDIGFVLLEGEKKDESGDAIISVKRTITTGNTETYVLKTLPPESSEIVEESFFLALPMNEINIDSLWNKSYYLANSSKIYIKYTNRDSYSGKFKVRNGQAIITEGTYIYKNGDKFEGNLSGKYFCGMPVDGKTTFNDGTVKEGNWIEKYLLTDNQRKKISDAKMSPSNARKTAISYVNDNKFSQLCKEAENYEKSSDYEKAKLLYLKALDYKSSGMISDRIKGLDKKIEKQKLVEKYGSRFANMIIDGKLETGMTKEMCELVLGNKVGMDFYRISQWTTNSGDHMETWVFDYNYGIEKENQRQLRENIKNNDESAFLVYGFINALGKLTSIAANSMAEYKYLKFRNSILIELSNNI